MLLNKLVSFNEGNNNKFKLDSILNLETLNLEYNVSAMPGCAAEEELLLLPKIQGKKIHFVSEPAEDVITEKELMQYIERYEQYVEKVLKTDEKIVHIVLNPKWFSLFIPLINHFSITIVTTEEKQSAIKEVNSQNIINVKDYLSLNDFVNYTNIINNKILVDLTTAYNDLYHYKIDFEKLLNSLKSFDSIDIIVTDNSYLPEFRQDNINIYTENLYPKERFMDNTYIYFYSNEPYSTRDVNRILFYAANSKVVYTNYNFYINNILPSVIMNLNKNDYSIKKLPVREAFDVINENRNSVLYNNSFINVLNAVTEYKEKTPLITPLTITDTKNNFEGNLFYSPVEIEGDVEVQISDSRYDIEKTLMFPLLFMGYSKVTYNNSSVYNIKHNANFFEINYYEPTVYKNDSEKLLSMIVPIHNNGRYLKFKCFNSILTLSVLENIEIIFIDDGSSDLETLRIIQDLLENYPFIKYKRYTEGSGSASRPRNSGMLMATCKFITFLDPDNEAVSDGYSRLLNEMETEQQLDMVVGNIVREDNIKRNDISYYKKVKNIQESEYINNSRKVLMSTNLGVQSIQALIVKKKIIDDNKLSMVEGAAGQDTLFFQELLLKCNETKVVNQNIHSYYAYVEGSVTNTVSHKFFLKFYKVEIERLKFLERENLINFYMERRFNSYMKNWYLKKLAQVKDKKEQSLAKQIIFDILELYNEYSNYYDDEIIQFNNNEIHI